jgi:hypothetical protein
MRQLFAMIQRRVAAEASLPADQYHQWARNDGEAGRHSCRLMVSRVFRSLNLIVLFKIITFNKILMKNSIYVVLYFFT